MVLVRVTPGELSACLTIAVELLLIPIAAVILSCATAIIYNVAVANGRKLHFDKTRRPFGWARKLPDRTSCILLLSLAAFLKCTVSILPAVAEIDFRALEVRENEDFSLPSVAARFNILTSFGSFLDGDEPATYQKVVSCTLQEVGLFTEYFAVQDKEIKSIKCLGGEDGYPLRKAGTYQSPIEDPSKKFNSTQIESQVVNVRLTGYAEVRSPSLFSVETRGVVETTGVFELQAANDEGRVCKGSAVHVYTGQNNQSAKVFGLCMYTGQTEGREAMLQRVFIHYGSNESLKDGMGSAQKADIEYSVFNGAVDINNGLQVVVPESNYTVIAEENVSYFHLNGSRVVMTAEKLRRFMLFVRPKVSEISGISTGSLVHFWNIYSTVSISRERPFKVRTGAKRIYTRLGRVATWAIMSMLMTLVVLGLLAVSAVWWVKKQHKLRLSLHSEEGLALYLLSVLGHQGTRQKAENEDMFTVESTERSGEISIRMGDTDAAESAVPSHSRFQTYANFG